MAGRNEKSPRSAGSWTWGRAREIFSRVRFDLRPDRPAHQQLDRRARDGAGSAAPRVLIAGPGAGVFLPRAIPGLVGDPPALGASAECWSCVAPLNRAVCPYAYFAPDAQRDWWGMSDGGGRTEAGKGFPHEERRKIRSSSTGQHRWVDLNQPSSAKAGAVHGARPAKRMKRTAHGGPV